MFTTVNSKTKSLFLVSTVCVLQVKSDYVRVHKVILDLGKHIYVFVKANE